MAKIKADSVGAIMERFGFIMFAPVLNFCRDDQTGTDNNLKELTSLLIKGYDPSKGVCSVMLPEGVPEWEKLVNEEMENRKNKWEDLKGSRNADPISLEVFEEIFTHDGKLLKPKYAANMCFQRGSVFFQAQVERRKLARSVTQSEEQAKCGNDGSLRDLWPISVKHYADEGERVADQFNENTGKNRGATPLTDVQQLRVGKLYWDRCFPQIRFRKEFSSDTIGQKIYYICELDSRFPKLRILERMRMSPDAEGYLPLSPCKHTELTHLAHATDGDFGRSEAEKKSIRNNPFLEAQEGYPNGVKHPAKEDIVAKYFQRITEGPATKPIMKRTDMTSIIKQCGSNVIADAIRAVLENNSDFVSGHTLCKHEHNLVSEIHLLAGKDGLERARVALESILAAEKKQYDETRSEVSVSVTV